MSSIEDKRKSLDNIDNAILLLLAERFRITKEIGLIKSEYNLAAKDSGREEQIFKRLDKLAEEYGLEKEFVRELWRKIIDQVIKNHDTIKSKGIER